MELENFKIINKGYSTAVFPQEIDDDEEDDIRNFIKLNTIKMNYAILKRTEAAERYCIHKKIPYAEALSKLKKSKIFEKGSIGGFMWLDKINDEKELNKCEQRKVSSFRSLKKNIKKTGENESESESESNDINLIHKIKERIKILNEDILELEKNEKKYKIEREKKENLKFELNKLLK